MIMRDMHLCINGVTRNSDQKSGFGDGLESYDDVSSEDDMTVLEEM